MTLPFATASTKYYNPVMSKYFTEALHNFTSDYAYGSQIKALYEKGLSTAQIKEKLDYPVSIEKVSSYLWEYLITSHQVVFDEKDIVSDCTAPKYEMETDSYGRRSFRLLSASTSSISSYNIVFVNHLSDIPDINACFIKIDGHDIKSYLEHLDSKQVEYLTGFPWPKRELYFHLNERMLSIIKVLYNKGLWNEAIICPERGHKYLLSK